MDKSVIVYTNSLIYQIQPDTTDAPIVLRDVIYTHVSSFTNIFSVIIFMPHA